MEEASRGRVDENRSFRSRMSADTLVRMEPTVSIVTFLIALPACFLGGLLNAISGGGGFITVPALMLAGLPPHYALSTDKIQSVFGMATASFRFIARGLVHWDVLLPALPAALIGSAIGAGLVVHVDAALLSWLLVLVLPVVAFITVSKHFKRMAVDSGEPVGLTQRLLCVLAAFAIGAYDGFYGPGSGTFLTIAFTLVAGMGIIRANAHSKVLNLTTNIAAIVVFALNGKVLLLLALACGAANMLGSWIGAGLIMKKGISIAKPCILLALCLLAAKVIGQQLGLL